MKSIAQLRTLKFSGLAAALLLLPLVTSHAADRWWDGIGVTNMPGNGDGVSQGATGTWNLTTNNWDQGSALPHINWVNANNDNAIFGGTNGAAKTVTVSSAVTVNQMIVTTNNYTIGAAASGPITFSGSYSSSTPTIDTSAGDLSLSLYSKITGTITGGLVIKGSNPYGQWTGLPAGYTAQRVYLINTSTSDFIGDITLINANLHCRSALGNAANKIHLQGGALIESSGSPGVFDTVSNAIVVDSNSGLYATSSSSIKDNVIMNLSGAITGAGTLYRISQPSGSGVVGSMVWFSGDMSGYTGCVTNWGTNCDMLIMTTATSAGGWVCGNAGVLRLGTNNATPCFSHGSGKQNLVIDGGTLQMNGQSETINGLVGGAGGFIENDLTNNATASVLTLGDADANGTYAGTIRNNNFANWNYGTNSNLVLKKTGNGTQILTGTNQCNGYIVDSGTLQFGDGSAASKPLAGPITNNSATLAFNLASANTLTLTNPIIVTGSGVITVTGADNTGILSLKSNYNFSCPVQVTGGVLGCTVTQVFAGPLSLSSAQMNLYRSSGAAVSNVTSAASLTLSSSALKFDFGGQAIVTPAPLQVAGALTNSGALTITLATVNAGSLALGTFPLVSYGSFYDAGGSSYVLGVTGVTSSQGYLTNDQPHSLIALVVTNLSILQWTGANGNSWDTGTFNWQLYGTATPATYADGVGVWFDDTGNNTSLSLSSTVNPAFIVVTNATKDYTFGGSVFFSAIGGAGSLTKQGVGTLSLTNSTYTYSGSTTVSGGTLVIGNGAADTTLGTSSIQDDAALVWNVKTGATPPVINGSGSVTYTNAGTVTLNTANGYTGPTTVVGGIVSMGNASAFGTAAGGTTMSAGSELDVTTAVNTAEPLTLGGGTGVTPGNGAFAVTATSGASTWSGAVTATGNTVFTIGNGASLNFSGGINGGANNLIFAPTAVSSSGYFTLSSNVTAGTLVVSNSSNMGGVVLTTTNYGLTNVLVSGAVNSTKPGFAGLWVANDLALGTNTVVTLTNGNVTGGVGARMVLNYANVPAGVSAQFHTPGTGDSGAGQYRTALSLVGTNVWNGSVTLHGADPSTAQKGFIQLSQDSGLATFNGNITLADGDAILGLRGAGGTGIINSHINLGTNYVLKTDPASWRIASTSNIWSKLQMTFGTLALGTNDALCTNAPVQFDLATALAGNPSPVLNLNGFNQHLPGIFTSGSGTAATPQVYNTGTNPATLVLSSMAGSNWVYDGALLDSSAASALNVEIAGTDPLTLTAGTGSSSYHGSTVIRSGATLNLSGSLISTLNPSTPVDVQAGGVLDATAVTVTAYPGTYRQITGVLKGSGQIRGIVTNAVGATIAPGDSIGTLTISSNLNIGGQFLFAVDKSLSPGQSNSVLSVGGAITNYGTGTLTVTNLNNAAPLVVGDKFTLFFNGQPVVNGNALNVVQAPGTLIGWSNSLAIDGSITVTNVPATNPTNITFSVSGGGSTLNLSWPSDHLLWTLQTQTNSLATGLRTDNWFNVPGSTGVTSTNFSINPTNPTVFFRLKY